MIVYVQVRETVEYSAVLDPVTGHVTVDWDNGAGMGDSEVSFIYSNLPDSMIGLDMEIVN